VNAIPVARTERTITTVSSTARSWCRLCLMCVYPSPIPCRLPHWYRER
jgi:hypothetical protein